MEDKCPNKAEFAVAWADKIMKMCEVHTRGLVMLARVIGSNTNPEKLSNTDISCMGPNDLDQYKKGEEDVK